MGECVYWIRCDMGRRNRGLEQADKSQPWRQFIYVFSRCPQQRIGRYG